MRSRAMRELDRTLRIIAPKDVGVALVGESGTGKEVLARRVHDLSSRRSGPFIPINCAAVPDGLFESELFGHEKGAFTGATERTHGKIEAAHGGTLFLDEIGEMPLSMQAKLLRFLENRKFMRVGGTVKIAVDARLIVATLRPLDQEVRAGRFRGDLYYRIQGITLSVPPLRERSADLALLVQQFSQELSARHGVKPARITRAAAEALRAHDWPGNVRELRNVMELVTLLRDDRKVRVQDLPPDVRRAAPVDPTQPTNGESETLAISMSDPLDQSIERIYDHALRLERGNRSRVARRLGVSLRTVQRHFATRTRSQ
ncbi:MAG: sigma-54-dependent Fis family transcriptional regulator [Polyangiaceae bacterium]|nr:sigma-54-dependent Fis family transcriptional regulator [Polyangiaceae bacterium]